MKDKPEQTDRNCVLENTGYPNKEIRMHAPGSSGPQPKGNQGEFSEKSGFKDVYCPWLAFLFFLKKLGLVFTCIRVLGKLRVRRLHTDVWCSQPVGSGRSKKL